MPDDYNTLLPKYNRLVSRFNDLQEQMDEKQLAWKALETLYKRDVAAARVLCEQILAKDPSEMVLGTEYSWGNLDTNTLLTKAINSYRTYNEGRTNLLKSIQAASEERRLQIESLTHQLSYKLQEHKPNGSGGGTSPSVDLSTGEVLEDVDAVSAPHNVLPTTAPDVEMALKKTSYKMQEAAKSGAIDVIIEEEDGDVSALDVRQQARMARLSEVVSIDKQGIRVSPSAKKQGIMQQERKKQAEVMVMDIEPVRSRMNDRTWPIIEIMGKYGYCERATIEDKYNKMYAERNLGASALSRGAFGYILKSMVDNNVIFLDTSAQHPVKSKFAVYYLSDIGKRFYTQEFGEPPATSERDVLIAQHDNLEHAFGIKTLKEILEASGEYTSVSMERSANSINMQDGTQYIPDIIAYGQTKGRDSKGFRCFMEYERDTHHQSDFNIKMNKMSKNTKWLNIVAPNAAVAKSLTEKVAKWVDSRGAQALRGIRVRVTSIKRLMDASSGGISINDDKSWYATFNLSNGPAPIIRDKTE